MNIRRRDFLSTTAALSFASRVFAAPAKRKTLILKSAWDTINIGDIGHTPGTLAVFEKNLPDVDVVLWATKLNLAVRGMLERRFPKVQIVQGTTGNDGTIRGDELIQAFDRADLVIHNSSMAEDPRFPRLCRKRDKPYGYFGQSFFAGFEKKDSEFVELLSGAAFCYARETLTLDTLKKAGVRSPVTDFNPDGCFGIDVRDDAPALAFLEERQLEPRQFITIQLRTNTQKHPGTDSFLNPANPTPQQQADDERRAEVFRKVVTTWVKATGLKVLIAPEVEKEIAHNKRLILDRLPADIAQHVVLRDKFWNADEAASVFAQARVVVCHEPHSLIIALANGTPILHAYSPFHSPKWHMFADIGLPEWLVPLDEMPAEGIAARLLSIHDDYPRALDKVQTAMRGVHERFAKSCDVIRQALNA